MKVSRFFKSITGRVIIDLLIITSICLVITLPFVFSPGNSKNPRTFNLKTIGSTSVITTLNELVENENENGFSNILNNIFGIDVVFQSAHTGSGAAFSTDSKDSQAYLGFQSSDATNEQLASWGYSPLPNTNALYSNWEQDAIGLILNQSSVIEQNITNDHYNFSNSNEIKEIYTSCPVDNSLQGYDFITPFTRDANSGTTEAFWKFINWNNSIDIYCRNTKEVSSEQNMLNNVNSNLIGKNSIGYASVMSFTDGDGNILSEYSGLHLATFEGVIPTIDTIKDTSSAGYKFKRPFNTFFRVEQQDSQIWIDAMFDPSSNGWDITSLNALQDQNNDILGAFLFYNWVLYSLEALSIVNIGGTDSLVPGPGNQSLSISDIAIFISETNFLVN